MLKSKKVNKNPARGKLFGVVINPKLNESIEWKEMSTFEIESSLKKLKFPNRFILTDILNELEIENVHKNKTVTDDFVGQLEIGTESSIPHYQLAISTSSICTRKKVLEALEEKIEGHINVEIQFNFEEMKNYCSKKSIFVSEEYSGKIYKHEWQMDFLERKPQLKKVLENPFEWQKFLKEEILSKNPDDRTVDWIIDPIGNTGKSSFARAYVSDLPTDGILMKIDNLDRMELTLIQKIENYRKKYYKDPKVLLFDFPRASDSTKIILATALMEDAKSGHLETTFGGHHKEIEISDVHVVVLSNTAPDLSVLSIDRWRLWRLGGEEYFNIIWPVKINSLIKKVNTRNWNIRWTVGLTCLEPMEIKNSSQFNSIELNYDWYGLKSKYDSREHFGFKKQYVKDMVTNINYSPNFVKIQVMERVTSEMTKIPIINFMLHGKKKCVE